MYTKYKFNWIPCLYCHFVHTLNTDNLLHRICNLCGVERERLFPSIFVHIAPGRPSPPPHLPWPPHYLVQPALRRPSPMKRFSWSALMQTNAASDLHGIYAIFNVFFLCLTCMPYTRARTHECRTIKIIQNNEQTDGPLRKRGDKMKHSRTHTHWFGKADLFVVVICSRSMMLPQKSAFFPPMFVIRLTCILLHI